ncbi:MAG: 50S ribosomal protein L21 [Candidatus Falkowbacteria bacterium]|nr:50S ribosomal protein L21 [Candidatus Falkowbacteria bacterium]
MTDSKIAVIKTGGKQYRVSLGTKLKVEKLDAKIEDKLHFDTLLISSMDGTDLDLGLPFLETKRVEGKILSHGKADKVAVVKYKNKTRYKRNVGHRQPYSEIEITKI